MGDLHLPRVGWYGVFFNLALVHLSGVESQVRSCQIEGDNIPVPEKVPSYRKGRLEIRRVCDGPSIGGKPLRHGGAWEPPALGTRSEHWSFPLAGGCGAIVEDRAGPWSAG